MHILNKVVGTTVELIVPPFFYILHCFIMTSFNFFIEFACCQSKDCYHLISISKLLPFSLLKLFKRPTRLKLFNLLRELFEKYKKNKQKSFFFSKSYLLLLFWISSVPLTIFSAPDICRYETSERSQISWQSTIMLNCLFKFYYHRFFGIFFFHLAYNITTFCISNCTANFLPFLILWDQRKFPINF